MIHHRSLPSRRFPACALTLFLIGHLGCGGTVLVNQGSYTRVIGEELAERLPATETGHVVFREGPRGLELKVFQARTCATKVIEHYELVNRLESRAKDDGWPALLWASGGSALLGGGMVFASRYQSTTGTDSEGKPTNPRHDMLAAGLVFIGISVVLTAGVVPITGLSEEVSSRGNRLVTRTSPCGSRPYEGAIEIINLAGGKRVFSRTDGEGRASVSEEDLGGTIHGQRFLLKAPAIGLEKAIESESLPD